MDGDAYEFTADWFSHNISNWRQLLAERSLAAILEIGSYEGRSACYVIENVAKLRPLELWCIDSWRGGAEHDPDAMGDVERRFDRNVAIAMHRMAHPVRLHKLRGPSNIELAKLLAAEPAPVVDLIYVDGSHQAADVLSDAVMSFPLLKSGGLMVFDDYLWREDAAADREAANVPKSGIDAFLNIYSKKMRVIQGYSLYQLYTEKISD